MAESLFEVLERKYKVPTKNAFHQQHNTTETYKNSINIIRELYRIKYKKKKMVDFYFTDTAINLITVKVQLKLIFNKRRSNK